MESLSDTCTRQECLFCVVVTKGGRTDVSIAMFWQRLQTGLRSACTHPSLQHLPQVDDDDDDHIAKDKEETQKMEEWVDNHERSESESNLSLFVTSCWLWQDDCAALKVMSSNETENKTHE